MSKLIRSTGKHDCNNKDIYEYDIIKQENKNLRTGKIVTLYGIVLQYDDGTFCVYRLSSKWYGKNYLDYGSYGKVICAFVDGYVPKKIPKTLYEKHGDAVGSPNGLFADEINKEAWMDYYYDKHEVVYTHVGSGLIEDCGMYAGMCDY